MPSDHSDRRGLDEGKVRCSSCGTVIYAWLDDCPDCGAHQGKEQLTIADRLRRAGVRVTEEPLRMPLEENCDEWHHDGSPERLHEAGLRTMGDVLNQTETALRGIFPGQEVFRRIRRFLPCPDTRPITDEERAWKKKLFGAARPEP